MSNVVLSKPTSDDIFENLTYDKYMEVLQVFNKYDFKLVPRNMRCQIAMLLACIYIYLRSNELESLYEEEIKNWPEGLDDLRTMLRGNIVSGVFSLYRDYPLSKDSKYLKFHLEHEVEENKTEENVPNPASTFTMLIQIHANAGNNKPMGVAYKRRYSLESDEFFQQDNLMEFALFLFIGTTTSAFSKHVIQMESVKGTTIYEKRKQVLFGDLEKPLVKRS